MPCRPNWRSSRCSSRSRSLVSKAANRLRRQRTDICPQSTAISRSSNIFVVAISELCNRRYADCQPRSRLLPFRCARRPAWTTLSNSLDRNGNNTCPYHHNLFRCKKVRSNTCYSAPIRLTSHRRGAQAHGAHRAASHTPAFIPSRL